MLHAPVASGNTFYPHLSINTSATSCSSFSFTHLDLQVTFVFLYLPLAGNICPLHLFSSSAPIVLTCSSYLLPPGNICPLETFPKDTHDLSYLSISSYLPLQVIPALRNLPFPPESLHPPAFIALCPLPTGTCTIPPVP